MNYPFFKSSWVVGLLLLLVVTSVIAQNNLMLSLDIKVTHDPIGSIDPLVFQLVLSNTGTEDYTGLSPWGEHTTTWVEFRAPNASKWQRLVVPLLMHSAIRAPRRRMRTFSLSAGKSQTLKLKVYNDIPWAYLGREKTPQYYFSTLGEYELRATYQPKEGQAIQSPIKRFRVEAYQGEDAKAYQWLKTRKIPHFMYKFGLNQHDSYFVNEEAQFLISQFPNSRFTPWAKFQLAYAYEFGLWVDRKTHNPPDLERAAALAREILELDSKSPIGQKVIFLADLQERAQTLLTGIEKRQGKTKTAQLSLEIQVLSDPLEPLEPLKYQLVLTNTGSEDYTDLARWDDIIWTTKVEYRIPNSSEWQGFGGKKTSRKKGNWRALSAGESKRIELSVLYGKLWFLLGGDITFCCALSGEYRLRATYSPYKKQTIQSNEVSFRVNGLKGIDAMAFQWLQERQKARNSRFKSDVASRLRFSMARRDAPEFISRFPNSRFVPWAKLLLIQHYKYGRKIDGLEPEPPNLEKAIAQAMELIDSADSTDGTVPVPPEVREAAQKLLKKLKNPSQ